MVSLICLHTGIELYTYKPTLRHNKTDRYKGYQCHHGAGWFVLVLHKGLCETTHGNTNV